MVSVVILAGGKSKRFGQDKAFVKIGGISIIQRIIAAVQPLTDDLLISTNASHKYTTFGLRPVADIYPGNAALGGIYSGLQAARYERALIVACDMPFLNINLLRYLIGLAPTVDAIVPMIKPQRPETLHAVYAKNSLPAIEAHLHKHSLRIVDMLHDISVRYVTADEISKLDPQFLSFTNLNTPDNLPEIETIAHNLDDNYS